MIVVGVDGSEGSRRALRWAYVEAGLRRCPVEVVSAWTTDEQLAGERQRHVVDGVQRQLATAVPTACEVVHGEPVDVLIRASEGADLLVLGSHGVSGLRHAGRTSVTADCVRLAGCACVVVPAAPAPADLAGQGAVQVALR